MTPADDEETGPDIKECYFMDIKGSELYIPPVNYVTKLFVIFDIERFYDIPIKN